MELKNVNTINWGPNAPADNLLVADLQPLGLDIELRREGRRARVSARPPPSHIHARVRLKRRTVIVGLMGGRGPDDLDLTLDATMGNVTNSSVLWCVSSVSCVSALGRQLLCRPTSYGTRSTVLVRGILGQIDFERGHSSSLLLVRRLSSTKNGSGISPPASAVCGAVVHVCVRWYMCGGACAVVRVR